MLPAIKPAFRLKYLSGIADRHSYSISPRSALPLDTITVPVHSCPSTQAGPLGTTDLICRNSSSPSSPPTIVKPSPRGDLCSVVCRMAPRSSAGFRVKNGRPPADRSGHNRIQVTRRSPVLAGGWGKSYGQSEGCHMAQLAPSHCEMQLW